MGCKPSRQSQAATGNMVCSGNLQSKQSNVSKEETEETVSNLIPHKAEENGNLLENVKVEEARLSDASDPEEGGKLITVDSPDRYFSPSKDEENLEGVIASFEYLSETKGSKMEEVEAVAMVEGEAVEMEKDAPENKDGDEEGEDEGETSSKHSADVKETIMVEEKESEATIAE